MNIKIDIELTPQELRQFIGLPDVAGLQDDMIDFVRQTVSKGVEGVDVNAIRQGIQGSKAWKRLLSMIAPEVADAADPRPRAPSRPRRRPVSPKKPSE
jgi:hypothetical protein